jgi:hypothetical protein
MLKKMKNTIQQSETVYSQVTRCKMVFISAANVDKTPMLANSTGCGCSLWRFSPPAIISIYKPYIYSYKSQVIII